MTEFSHATDADSEDEMLDRSLPGPTRGARRWWTRTMILLRRIHLYAGLFLLPWVLLYGVTGAMFNHQGLFPEAEIQPVATEIVEETSMADFPSAEVLAGQVTDALQSRAGEVSVTLADDHRAAYTSGLMFEAHASDKRHVVEIDPVTRAAHVRTFTKFDERPPTSLKNIRQVTLDPNPHDAARAAAGHILNRVGLATDAPPQPLGWTKLNFLANLDGEPAHVTYVLKDGHVDVTRYLGEDGMSPRHFFLRLHTTHGRSPHWNGRGGWSLLVDVMAIAMVIWSATGLLMWWQVKRTRAVGSVVILASLVTAAVLFASLHDFYSTTRL